MDSNVLNISDVIEVLETTDPQYINSTAQGSTMYSPPQGGEPRVEILEQPAPKALRFRYECEGRSAGSIPGVNSTPENKTFPTIQVVNYQGRAVVVVSCVTKDPPYRTHPHNLVGKDGCKRGVCTLEIQENMTCSFSNLGIQCVKKKDIEEALTSRESIRVDPFRLGFDHKRQPTSIDLNAVRLCFQVFLEGPEPGKFKNPLPPVVSDIIYDKKAMSDLTICRLSDASCNVSGGREIILLCEKVAKEDISVRFYEEKNGLVEWEALGEFSPTDVHKQVAITFRVPSYRDIQIQKEVDVKVQLRRPSDGATSEPRDFKYTPLDSAPKRKSKITDFAPSKRAMPDPSASSGAPSDRKTQSQQQQQQQQQMPQINTFNLPSQLGAARSNSPFTMAPHSAIKREPSESNYSNLNTYSSNPHQVMYLSPNYQQPSSPANFSTLQPPQSVSPLGRCSPGVYQLVANPNPTQHVQCSSPLHYPSTSQNTQFTHAGAMQVQQPTNTFMQNPFNIRPNNPVENQGNLQLLNMDTHQNIDMTKVPTFPTDMTYSSELASFSSLLENVANVENLTENLSGNLRLCDEVMSTDSITGIANNVYDKITKGQPE